MLCGPFVAMTMLGMGPWQLDDFKQKQDENDGQDERKAAAAVVAETGSHTIAAKAEHQNQNNQKDKHLCFLRSAKFRLMEV